MRHIKIGSLTLLAGGTRLEREEEMGEYQSATRFIEAAIRDTQTHDSGVLLTQLPTVPRFCAVGGAVDRWKIDGRTAFIRSSDGAPAPGASHRTGYGPASGVQNGSETGAGSSERAFKYTASSEVDVGLEAVEEVAHTILQGILEDENIDFVLGGMERSDEGASFVLATTERLVKEGTP